jgi:hypothetical protein
MTIVRVLLVVAIGGALATGVACSLNPQPLPPAGPDGGLEQDSGAFKNSPDTDGGAVVPTAASDAGDMNGGGGGALDGSDAGDASVDASDDATPSDAGDSG